MSKELTDFLKRKKETRKKSQQSIKQIKQKWIEEIDDFNANIKHWLRDAQTEGLIKVQEYEKRISEEKLGTYKVKGLLMRTDGNTIKIEPVGREILGAIGRIDIGPYKFVLHPPPSAGWKLVQYQLGKTPYYTLLTEDLFIELLKNMLV